MSEPKPGDKVRYVADNCHWNGADRVGAPVFEFVHHEDPPRRKGESGARAGDVVADHTSLGRIARTEHQPDGLPVLHMERGHKIRPTRPLAAWEATVLRVNADGSADLEIRDPCGYRTHTCPDREGVAKFAAKIRGELDKEAAHVAAGGTGVRYEIAGRSATREEWRAWMQSLIRDPEDLRAVPGLPHDPTGKTPHSWHLPGEGRDA